ncbi:ABC transporter permease subunit [Aeromicrobium sp. YIM 150415]|uniref:amino acid ABC transporter permease n=1 Tax=Aeromicrobium sp. YIM 150415 TaxID=2803912 RepID=UPI0019634CF0|nr:ABC transporter permease subunit [Aeromicrobium sp. YIM 150415]MBM9463361.1 ABC transporter permease subunit [Aeromicrobium sp. YIM 150415]
MTSVPQETVEASSSATLLAPPPRTDRLIAAASILTVIALAVSYLAVSVATSKTPGSIRLLATIGVLLIVVGVLGASLAAATKAAGASRAARRAGDIVSARHAAARSRHHSLRSMAYSGFFVILAAVVLLVCADDFAVQETFFRWDLIQLSAGDITKAFAINVLIACSAQILAMLFGLVLAIGRSLPGDSFRPLRVLAVMYIDGFRSLPAIVVIYLICLGLPLSGVPVISDANPIAYAIIALSMTFSAYNAELFRSGMESIHHSQISAAYSLGMSPASVYRLVVLPQVARRLAPAMLGAFVMLQKDTALVNIVGIVDAFQQSKIYSGNYYNLSSIVVVCVLFIACTIPQTRFVDYQLAKARRRETA